MQDLRTPASAGDPTGLDGSLIRIDPATGAGAPNNPLKNSKDANERRMIGYGLRDSVRLAIRPGTSEVWVTDRGGGYWEEFMRVQTPVSAVQNFGYPCYEGGIDATGNPFARIRPASHAENLNICENLYKAVNATVAPYWGYDHELPVVPTEKCTKDALGSPAGSLLSGAAFYPKAGNYPALYKGALFFSDRLRDCIYALLPGADGLPQRGKVVQFASAANRANDLEFLPNGDMLYVDQRDNVVQRVAYGGTTANRPPTAVAVSSITSGVAPLIVAFDAAGSTDPDLGDVLTYEWDLDGDGQFDDSTAQKPTFTYTKTGTYKVQLRVKDRQRRRHHRGDHDHRREGGRREGDRGGGRRARRAGQGDVELRHAELTARSRRHQAGGGELPALHGVGHHRSDPEREAASDRGQQRDCGRSGAVHRFEHLDRDRHQVEQQAGAQHNSDRRRGQDQRERHGRLRREVGRQRERHRHIRSGRYIDRRCRLRLTRAGHGGEAAAPADRDRALGAAA